MHTATCYGRKGESFAEIMETNVIFPLKICTIAKNQGVNLFINIHTCLDRRVSPYSLSKHQFIEWLHYLNTDLKIIHLEMEHFYGPDNNDIQFITWLFKELRKGSKTIPLTHGMQKRDFIYISDVIDAILLCLNEAKTLHHGEHIQIGTGYAPSIRQVAEKCHKISGSASSLDFGALPLRKSEMLESKADLTRLKDLGWHPKIDLEDGLQQTWQQTPGNKQHKYE